MNHEKLVVVKDYPGQCLANLNRQRKEEFLCDVVLCVNEKKFPAHKTILAASCEYFATMFRTNMKEKYSEIVHLKQVSPNAIEGILEFIYSGNILLCSNSVDSILQAASLFQLQNLLKIIDTYLLEIVEPLNSLQLNKTSQLFSLTSLEQKTEDCIFEHFGKVCTSKDFLNLSKNEVQKFLKSEKINVESEDILFTALVNWTHHNLPARQKDFQPLFGLIRLQFISIEFLSNTVRKQKLVRDLPRCRDLVEDAMHYKLQPHLFQKQKPRVGEAKRNKQWFLLTENDTVEPLKFSSQGDQREVVQPHLNVSYKSAIALHENKVMFCGGCSDQSNTNNAKGSIISFDGNVWKEEGNLNFPRYDATAVSVKGALYIFGGQSSFGVIENRTERFLKGNCKTIFIHGHAVSRSLACAVVIKDSVFVIGGSNPQQGSQSFGLQQLHFGGNEYHNGYRGNQQQQPRFWDEANFSEYAIQLNRPRQPHSGEYNDFAASSSVDCINISSKQLRKIAPLNEGRTNFAATVIESTIYVFGGFSNYSDNLSSAEFLDTRAENQIWTFLTDAPILLPIASSCLISDDEIIVLGGDSDQLFCYDTTSGTWKTSVKTEQEKLGNAVAGAKIFGLGM